MEHLEIKNFLTIKEAYLDVKRLTFLIGVQATGKSVIAKLLFFFQDFLTSDLVRFVQTSENKRNIERKMLSFFEIFFPKYTWNGQEFFIRYIINDVQVTVQRERNNKGSLTLKFTYSQEIDELRKKAKSVLKRKQQESQDEEIEQTISSSLNKKGFLFTHAISKCILESEIGRDFKEPIFIPASRSFFANFQQNVFSFLANNISIEPFISQFGSVYERARRLHEALEQGRLKLSTKDKEFRSNIKKLMEGVLSGEYLYEDGEDWISSSKRKINVSNASSGQQEALPMLLVLSVLPIFSRRQVTFFIEEPETHLFPFAQKYMANLFALIYNNRKQSSFLITTHSPYILTAFNNMIMASNIYKSSKEEIKSKIIKIIKPDNFIDYDNVAAYTIKDGYVKSILDEEIQLIGSSIIDSVSDEFETVFDKLIELQIEG
jgi:hypothetical protein